ncbi:MAG: sugar kinase [Spirochaetaceae bacterium]|nr:sugar kinase [Spirochaetaceae bacterium]
MKKIVCFGEIMMRLNPLNKERFIQADNFAISYSGAEANVCASLANYFEDSSQIYFVSKVPANELGKSSIKTLRSQNINTEYVVQGGQRLGLYFLEEGASQRPSKVIYDRKNSSFAESSVTDYNWDIIFEDCTWFHFSGITPALSDNLAEICKIACKKAKEKNIKISCDLNYRKKLWTTEKANSVMSELFEFVDVCIANEEDVQNVFGLQGSYEELAQKIIQKFSCKLVAFTLRESFSADKNIWSSLLFSKTESFKSEKYEIQIVDRVGAGDSFSGALIYALLNDYSNQNSLEFATAASCLKHSIHGDFNQVTVDEVLSLMKGNSNGRIQR